jgi:hypothetical protein
LVDPRALLALIRDIQKLILKILDRTRTSVMNRLRKKLKGSIDNFNGLRHLSQKGVIML